MTAIFSKEAMESHLNDEEKAASRAFEVLAENSLMMSVAYFRFGEYLDAFMSHMPFGIFRRFLFKRYIKSRVSFIFCATASKEEWRIN